MQVSSCKRAVLKMRHEIKSFKDLIVWKKSFDLVKKIYTLTKSLPSEEKFGLVSQMQRCAVSIPSNIAEGKDRQTANSFRYFLTIARGSASELETQLLLCKDIYHIDIEVETSLNREIQAMLVSIIKKL